MNLGGSLFSYKAKAIEFSGDIAAFFSHVAFNSRRFCYLYYNKKDLTVYNGTCLGKDEDLSLYDCRNRLTIIPHRIFKAIIYLPGNGLPVRDCIAVKECAM